MIQTRPRLQNTDLQYVSSLNPLMPTICTGMAPSSDLKVLGLAWGRRIASHPASSTEMLCIAALHKSPSPYCMVRPSGSGANPRIKAHRYMHVFNVAMYRVWLPCAEVEVSFTSANTDAGTVWLRREQWRNTPATKYIVPRGEHALSALELPPCATRPSVWL